MRVGVLVEVVEAMKRGGLEEVVMDDGRVVQDCSTRLFFSFVCLVWT